MLPNLHHLLVEDAGQNHLSFIVKVAIVSARNRKASICLAASDLRSRFLAFDPADPAAIHSVLAGPAISAVYLVGPMPNLVCSAIKSLLSNQH